MKIDLTTPIVNEDGEPVLDKSKGDAPVKVKQILLTIMLRPIESDRERKVDETLDAYMLREDIRAADGSIVLTNDECARLLDRANKVYAGEPAADVILGQLARILDPARFRQRKRKAVDDEVKPKTEADAATE